MRRGGCAQPFARRLARPGSGRAAQGGGAAGCRGARRRIPSGASGTDGDERDRCARPARFSRQQCRHAEHPGEIRVNAVAPGFVDSPWNKDWPPDRKAASIERTPLKRACKPEDIAETIFFLCAGGAMITGQTIIVDGGLTL
jgi:hypothetical protein